MGMDLYFFDLKRRTLTYIGTRVCLVEVKELKMTIERLCLLYVIKKGGWVASS